MSRFSFAHHSPPASSSVTNAIRNPSPPPIPSAIPPGFAEFTASFSSMGLGPKRTFLERSSDRRNVLHLMEVGAGKLRQKNVPLREQVLVCNQMKRLRKELDNINNEDFLSASMGNRVSAQTTLNSSDLFNDTWDVSPPPPKMPARPTLARVEPADSWEFHPDSDHCSKMIAKLATMLAEDDDTEPPVSPPSPTSLFSNSTGYNDMSDNWGSVFEFEDLSSGLIVPKLSMFELSSLFPSATCMLQS